MTDPVNHPPHYAQGEIEHITYLDDRGWTKGFCLGNASKYLHRAEHKGKELEDLKKAAWYLNHYIQYLEKQSNPTQS